MDPSSYLLLFIYTRTLAWVQVAAFIVVVVLVSIICLGLMLFIKWRNRRKRGSYERILERDNPAENKGPEAENIYSHNQGHIVINLSHSAENISTAETLQWSGSAVRPTPKAKEVKGDLAGREERRSKKRIGEQSWQKQIQVNEIKIVGRIGRGSYGDVFKGVWQGTVVAVKKLPGYFIELREEESAVFLDNFHREADIMK